MKRYVELEYEQIDRIVIDELLDHRDLLKSDFEKRLRGECGALFEHDIKQDKKVVDKYLKAFDLLLNYYGVKND